MGLSPNDPSNLGESTEKSPVVSEVSPEAKGRQLPSTKVDLATYKQFIYSVADKNRNRINDLLETGFDH